MRRILMNSLLLFIMLSAIYTDSAAQFWYSKYYKNFKGLTLQDMTYSELSFLYLKAADTKKAGIIFTAGGFGLSGLTLFSSFLGFWGMLTGQEAFTNFSFSSILYYGGLAIGITGITLIIVGSMRQHEILYYRNKLPKDARLLLLPSINYNRYTNTPYAGLTLFFRF